MASGDTLAVWDALAARGPASNYPTLDVRSAHVVLDFDASTAETAYFLGVLPSIYAGGAVAATIHWAATSATSGSVRWSVQFERLEAGGPSLDSADFQTAAGVTSAANATAGKLAAAAVTVSAVDSAIAGNAFRIAVQRDATHAADTITGDAELLAVELREV